MRRSVVFALMILLVTCPLLASSLNDRLLKAAETDDLEAVNRLLRDGADVNYRGPDSETPLMKACRSAKKNVIERLLKAGAKPDLRNKDGLTAMDIAMDVPPGITNQGATASASKKPEPLKTRFDLVEVVIASDTIKTHKALWVAATQSGSANGPRFSDVLRAAMAQGQAVKLHSGTSVTLTGKATGIVSQVTTPDLPGKWWIPNEALKAAKVTVPLNTYGQLDVDTE